jgi:hypothetical protein
MGRHRGRQEAGELKVAYSKRHLPHPLATHCRPLPPNQHATFYATFWRKRSISRENNGLEPSYSGSYGSFRTSQHEAAG